MRRSLIFSKEKSPLPHCSISFFCEEGIHPARGRRGGRLEDEVRARRGLVLVRPFAPLRGGSRQSRSAVGVGHTRVSRAGSDGVASSDTSLGGWVMWKPRMLSFSLWKSSNKMFLFKRALSGLCLSQRDGKNQLKRSRMLI